MTTTDLLRRRARLLGARAPLFYDEPLHIVRGEGVWLYDAAGRRYLDCYNNVPHVGHCHPHVVAALARQAATLNVHTRYLHETILEYGERLTSRFAPSLSMVLFVCTGSEANDQALRIARLHTGATGIICTNTTYHGNTTAVDELATLFHGGAGVAPHVRAVPFPDSYRPLGGLAGAALAAAYAQEVRHAIEAFQADGVGFAGMLVCPIFANEGLPVVPPGFMEQAVRHVREAGGLYIADEVQAGFGRTGRMWGYEIDAVVPDIVTLGKPMGNGHPLAAVVTRADLLEEFRAQVMYFNTFGGNPVSCAVGNAVLDVIDAENLVDNARVVGEYVRAGLRAMQDRHRLIGDVRGHGLWIGAELVCDRETRLPAAGEAHRTINMMKDRGVLMGRIGPHDNVLKIRPPMPFSRGDADLLLATLDEVLGRIERDPQ
ncbi:MAG: aminotransferase class III-fold pyridoxal phosphate-dependent enzyme [Gammaproteobacteria bacterium]|nr:aminotransferase class III-fold pyridoxal phosphate-dependent enzyme [Gammaproteobacteria bacterium]